MDPTFPQFESLEELGAGATGRVYRVVLGAAWGELPSGAELALKRLHPEAEGDPRLLEAFEREVEVTTTLRAPGLLRGYGAGRDDTSRWLALEYLPGRDLREALEGGVGLPEPAVRAAGLRLAGALVALEHAGYLHGDLKPENVRYDREGRAVLIDLGFTRPLGAERGERERVAGSLPYLSPEEASGGVATPLSEVFSLGLVLYELATGAHPFIPERERADEGLLLSALRAARFRPPSLIAPTISPFLDLSLEAMLAPRPEDRPSLEEVRRRFEEQEGSPWWRRELDRTGPTRRALPTAAPQDELPLVGRDEELATLFEASRLTLTRRGDGSPAMGGVVELSGSGGSGKSRLMRAFAGLARRSEDPPVYLYGRCRAFEDQRPCQPILALVHRYLSLPVDVVPGERERELLDGLVPREELETVLDALDPDFEGKTPVAVPLALSTLLQGLAARRPLLLFLDDLQHADEGTLEVLIRLVESLPGLPLLLVLGQRTEVEVRRPQALARLRERAKRLPFQREVHLGPLSPAAVRALVEASFSSKAPRLRLAAVLHERSHGNPGLISELLRGLRASGEVRPGLDGLELLVHPDELPLPASLGEEIAASYARLGPRDRAWLSRLSVAGGRIQTAFLARAWPGESRSELEETLTRLTHAGWLTAAGDRYRFRRPAQREAIYKSLKEERRRRLHEDVARALRPGPGGKLSIADALQRAFHLRAAGRSKELLRILRPLLERFGNRGQPQRVLTLARWGLEAIADLSASEGGDARTAARFLIRGADAADLLGQREVQREMLDALSELDLSSAEAPYEVGMVYLLHARYSISTGQYGAARGMLRAAIDHLARARRPAEQSDALRRLAGVHSHVGELGRAERLGKRALALAVDDGGRAQCELVLGVVDLLEDRIEAALRRGDRALMLVRHVEGVGALAVRARAYSLRARTYRGAGRPRRAQVSAQRAVHFAQRSGDRRLETELRARLGAHLLDLDRVAEAESTLRDALLAATEIEDRRGEAIASLFLGILLAEQNDPAAGGELARSTRIARELGLNRVHAVGLAIQARRRYWHDPSEAIEASTRAVELVEQNGAELIDRVVILGIHAVILDATGQHRAGAELVRGLRRRLRSENARIESPLLRRRHRLATTRLLEAVLSTEGPVYRRVRLG